MAQPTSHDDTCAIPPTIALNATGAPKMFSSTSSTNSDKSGAKTCLRKKDIGSSRKIRGRKGSWRATSYRHSPRRSRNCCRLMAGTTPPTTLTVVVALMVAQAERLSCRQGRQVRISGEEQGERTEPTIILNQETNNLHNHHHHRDNAEPDEILDGTFCIC